MNPARAGPAWGPDAQPTVVKLVSSASDISFTPAAVARPGELVGIVVALAVGVVVGLGVLAAVGAWWWTRRRGAGGVVGKGRKPEQVFVGRSEVHAESAVVGGVREQLDVVYLQEMEAVARHELAAGGEVEIGV